MGPALKLNIVPPRTGFFWVKLGIRAFARKPMALTGLFFMFMAVMSIATMVPVIGSALALALLPAATLGLMAATQEATRGKFPMPSILVTAFRPDPITPDTPGFVRAAQSYVKRCAIRRAHRRTSYQK